MLRPATGVADSAAVVQDAFDGIRELCSVMHCDLVVFAPVPAAAYGHSNGFAVRGRCEA
ncbi:hypothetical protein ACJWDR_44050 [Streptomyces tauricus]|uniref:hypothetical protein n=1 Tax=Streptomyces tauricus TaxID=68274 RepID=UPI00387EE8D3